MILLQKRAQHIELTFLTFIVTKLVRLFDCKHFNRGKEVTDQQPHDHSSISLALQWYRVSD